MGHSRSFKASILASGQFLTTCVGLLSAAVLARIFTLQDYATYQQTMLAYFFAVPLLTLGLPQALYYFLPAEKERSRSILMDNLVLLGLMGGVFSLFLLLGGNRLLAMRFNNPRIAGTLQILVFYPLFMLPIEALTACLMARNRPKYVAIYNVVSRIVKLLFILGLTIVWRTPMAAVLGSVIAAAIIFVPAMKLMINACNEGPYLPSWHGMWSQILYAVPLGLAGMIGTITRSLDKVIVSSMCGPEQFAIFTNGAVEIPLFGILTSSVTAVLIPDFVKMYRASDYNQFKALWHRAMTKCFAIILPVTGFTLAMAPEIMRVLFSSKYEDSAAPFRVYALMLPLRATTFGAIFMAINRTKVITFGEGICLFGNAVLSVLFVKFWGPIGAAWGTIVTTFGIVIIYIVLIGKYLNFNYTQVLPWKHILRTSIAVSIPALFIYFCSPFLPHNDIIRLGITAVGFGFLVVFSYHLTGTVTIKDSIAQVKALIQPRVTT